mmetsp:Transcript_41565/g.98509  ORF Transcript_41565/g.98509 Transcript_41565/m.98509 type:complete len:226 (+) Transcript_41565:386-1063(+)
MDRKRLAGILLHRGTCSPVVAQGHITNKGLQEVQADLVRLQGAALVLEDVPIRKLSANLGNALRAVFASVHAVVCQVGLLVDPNPASALRGVHVDERKQRAVVLHRLVHVQIAVHVGVLLLSPVVWPHYDNLPQVEHVEELLLLARQRTAEDCNHHHPQFTPDFGSDVLQELSARLRDLPGPLRLCPNSLIVQDQLVPPTVSFLLLVRVCLPVCVLDALEVLDDS